MMFRFPVLFLVIFYPCFVAGTITLTATGQHFDSRADARVGTRFLQGFEYLARLQVFQHDLELCSSEDENRRPLNLTVNVPPDGLPVAILARNSGCSVETKARLASRAVSPPHTLKYLILYGDDGLLPRRRSFDYDIDVSVGVLHVSERSGNELLWTITNESEETKEAGGPRLLLDGRDAARSRLARDLTLWMGIGVLMMACLFSFFLSVRAQQGAFRSEPIPAAGGATRQAPRRLTLQQVQELVPEYTASDYVCLDMDQACSICLDEYEAADKCRELPCGHVFHSDCIRKWLTERSSTCPLCKTDLLSDDNDEYDELEHSDSGDESSVNLGVFSFMDRVLSARPRTWWRRRRWAAAAQSQESSGGEQEMTADNEEGVSELPLLEHDYESGSEAHDIVDSSA